MKVRLLVAALTCCRAALCPMLLIVSKSLSEHGMAILGMVKNNVFTQTAFSFSTSIVLISSTSKTPSSERNHFGHFLKREATRILKKLH